ncbi:MAG TPA: phenylalanine--tRNA ligase subunit alpha [Candidatus Nanoarchaeia archaeon]|nr:phenylalanine--tRNA ligase subunit alpha [Candidatus Nanoarchaeia archaeon]
MDIDRIVESFHPLERKVFPALTKEKTVQEVAGETGLQEVEVMRAFQWLENKNLVTLKEKISEIANLGKNGILYAKKGLPERRFLEAIEDKPLDLDQVAKTAGLEKEEIGASLGALKGKAAINVKSEKGKTTASITEQGKKLLAKGFFEEDFLRKKFPLSISELREEEKFALANLRKRKDIVIAATAKIKSAELTDLGRKAVQKAKVAEKFEDRLTHEMLLSGEWKDRKFRRYDVKINVPAVYAGKKQHYRIFLDEVRRKFVSLGFREITGPIVETDFWNMDALYMPQFHSARDIHDAYYIKEPQYGKLDEKLVERVKQAHENGFGTGSKGWRYEFDVKRTHRHLLRTQTTACSARLLASKELKIPGKYFAIARCFRHDVIDATHLADFNQIEGFVIDENLNFRHLMGLLKTLAEEFCHTEEVKITPAYFPFTEPSAELHAKHPQLGWIELGGSGIFRPEMLKPLGIDKPVIAWGIGIDRLAMFRLGLNDIRELFSHDLKFLRNAKVI